MAYILDENLKVLRPAIKKIAKSTPLHYIGNFYIQVEPDILTLYINHYIVLTHCNSILP